MAELKRNPHPVMIDGKRRLIDAALVPAVECIPLKLRGPVLEALARDFEVEQKRFLAARKKEVANFVAIYAEAEPYLLQGWTLRRIAMKIAGRRTQQNTVLPGEDRVYRYLLAKRKEALKYKK